MADGRDSMSEPSIEPIITECPECATKFRVTEEQLEIAQGRVRCGACLAVFQARDHLVWADVKDTQSNPALSLDEVLSDLETRTDEDSESAPADGSSSETPDPLHEGDEPEDEVRKAENVAEVGTADIDIDDIEEWLAADEEQSLSLDDLEATLDEGIVDTEEIELSDVGPETGSAIVEALMADDAMDAIESESDPGAEPGTIERAFSPDGFGALRDTDTLETIALEDVHEDVRRGRGRGRGR